MLPTIYQPRLARREAIQSLLGLLGNSASSNNDSLTTLLALDVLLAALVDHPPGVRMFEQLSGLELVVRLLRNKEAGKHTRMKALEFLHFYLLPESSTDLTPRSPSKLRRVSPSASLVSSRSRQRTASGGSTASSVSCSSLFASISEEGTSSPQRSESRVPWSPQTPRRARAPDSPSRSPALRSPVKVLEIPPTPEQDDANILVVPQTSSPAGSVMRTPERKDDNENVSPFARPLRASLAMTPPRRSRPLSESSPAHQSPNKRLQEGPPRTLSGQRRRIGREAQTHESDAAHGHCCTMRSLRLYTRKDASERAGSVVKLSFLRARSDGANDDCLKA
ncbi:uncharacterized protein L969DRAFT_43366 [Mixia osmundae IAM 14324]|uniref:Cell division control protein 14 n=1 Tax=Mixia osmundae (strain CBS 9802 / IAM 14324 / JCM 22182 / KY 12970) TaxID=764103 RepID=G7DTK6_MIXOS|nr:uncharacterized protein L969DRAFT_43366 [Mixia osmundae IAM 14324]KEI42810.1 hypothetical protein L969DRAFT_43366 [Mixia osmundae IAM 14324]GAA93853.1 hypothetical protein E5Q_00499 [Mixia osmundae IAM 14324]